MSLFQILVNNRVWSRIFAGVERWIQFELVEHDSQSPDYLLWSRPSFLIFFYRRSRKLQGNKINHNHFSVFVVISDLLCFFCVHRWPNRIKSRK